MLWLEQRPAERGRTTTLLRRFGSDEDPTELTPQPINLRSRVHDYGGGVSPARRCNGHTLLLAWIDGGDGGLWRQDWQLCRIRGPFPHPAPPRRLTIPGAWQLADGVLVDQRRNRWIGVREIDGRDQLVSVALDGCDQTPSCCTNRRTSPATPASAPMADSWPGWNGNNRRCPGTAARSGAPS